MYLLPYSSRFSREGEIQQGFTLVELMMVVLLMSIMAGLAVVTFNPSPSKLLKKESEQLRALILLARDEAIFRSKPLALEFYSNRYFFSQSGEKQAEWVVLKDKQLIMRRLAKPLQVTIYRDDLLLEMVDPDDKKSGDEVPALAPQVFFLPSGEMSPFEVVFEYPAKALLRVSFDAGGKAKVVMSRVF